MQRDGPDTDGVEVMGTCHCISLGSSGLWEHWLAFDFCLASRKLNGMIRHWVQIAAVMEQEILLRFAGT